MTFYSRTLFLFSKPHCVVSFMRYMSLAISLCCCVSFVVLLKQEGPLEQEDSSQNQVPQHRDILTTFSLIFFFYFVM